MNSTSSFEPHLQAMLGAQTEADEIKAALALADHYETLLAQYADQTDYTSTSETFLEGGVALASQYALDCLRDPLRTTRFICGCYDAVLDQLQQQGNTTVNLLYAGCGPAAPLVLPFLCRFDPQQLQITLLDITESSLKAVEKLVEKLDLSTYISSYVLADAITYEHPVEKPLNLIISETMDKGLTREPQVRVMQNLVPQLASGGVFIPESISVFGELTFHGKEPYFDIHKDLSKLPPTYQTASRKKLFTIDRTVHNKEAFSYTSDYFDKPKDLSQTPDVAVFAEICIYKERVLPKAKSLLSNSVCIRTLHNLDADSFKLHYQSKGTPGWELLTD